MSSLSPRNGEISLAGQSSKARCFSLERRENTDVPGRENTDDTQRTCWSAGLYRLACCSHHSATPREEEEEKYKGDDVELPPPVVTDTARLREKCRELEEAKQIIAEKEFDVHHHPKPVNEREGRWIDMAEKRQLDVYTCMALRKDHSEDKTIFRARTGDLSHHTGYLQPQAEDESDNSIRWTCLALIGLQVVVPLLMIAHQLRNLPTFATDAQFEFRVVGFILYLYSIRSMYMNTKSECRTIYLEVCFEYNLPWHNVWPAVLGEVVNAFAAFTLTVTLFTVFCSCAKVQDLVVNCIAINFIGSVDNEFTSDVMKDVAIDNFHKIVRTFQGTKRRSLMQAMEDSPWRNALENVLAAFLFLLRIGGTLCLGLVLGLMFLFSHFTLLCSAMGIRC